MIKMIWKTLAVDKMDIEKTADLKCISRLLVEKWHVDQIKMKITVSLICYTVRFALYLVSVSRFPWKNTTCVGKYQVPLRTDRSNSPLFASI